MIPELYRVALAYGLHPLTGEQSPAGEWRARNVVRWCRPNPPVGALGDKVRPATSDMVMACTSRTRWFDLDAVRTQWARDYSTEDAAKSGDREFNRNGTVDSTRTIMANAAGAPPLDHWWFDDEFEQDAWLIPTAPYKGSHYATWPAALCERPIKSMCPQRVCTVCGEPSRRIVSGHADNEENAAYLEARATARHGERLGMGSTGRRHAEPRRVLPTGDWTDCGHDAWRNGVVLDPFGGSGTTAMVATGHGRDCILIDLDARNAQLVRERVGMFLTVHDPTEALA